MTLINKRCPNLVEIDFHSNQIKEKGIEIGKFPRLTHLNLNNNKLKSIIFSTNLELV